MKNTKVMRIVLDAAMSLMIVFEMLIQFTGEFLHEVVGFTFFATVAVHIALSAAWTKKTVRIAKEGKLTARRTALAVVGCLLALTMVVLGVSSVAISGILSSAGFTWPLGSYSMWATVHMLSSYALCAIVVVHLAMHWAFVASAAKVRYDPSRRRAISASVNAVAALGVLALGVTAAGKMAPQVASAEQRSSALGNASDTDAATDTTGSGGTSGSDGTSSTNGSGGSGATGNTGNAGNAGGGSSSTSGGHGHSGHSGKQWDNGNNNGNSSSTGSSGSAGGSASGGSTPQPSQDGNDSSGSGSGSAASGICTLCRKLCPLSAPKCNKPYEAGLL